jgi:hypothetical protein
LTSRHACASQVREFQKEEPLCDAWACHPGDMQWLCIADRQ